MEFEPRDAGLHKPEARMLGDGAVAQIFALQNLGWSIRKIAREVGLSRNTVRDWLRGGPDRSYGNGSRAGLLDRYYFWIQNQFNAGVRNADVLRQELEAIGVSVSLRTVERALRPFRQSYERAEQATVRFETPPGKQMQVDFGEKWLQIGGVRQKRYVFVATLGYSRRCYIEISGSLRQRDWIMGIERAFQHFEGVPEILLTDNAKPLVDRRKGGIPVFHPEFDAFCRHWGTVPRACQPFRAKTKGKVERSVGYAKGNALGREGWESDEALDEHLVWWMLNVADTRIHGTIGERPIDRFPAEKAALRPIGNHPSYLLVRHLSRTVAADGRIDVDTNRYSVPPQFIGATLEVTVEADTIQVFCQDQVIAEHPVHPGRRQVIEDPGHAVSFTNGIARVGKPSEIRRPLSHYAAIVGGEAW
ncbi:IS21 family transposase [Mesoterricola sediminis]|uniref:Transposase n=1 Tax=Mesoterricola sediminis TaxID=2927980 RepID=A0AA48KAW3_9BACT|nr:IS21 family transposase [Mesoterricola sediminis]BDU75484.1 transposase [Mesoterricola sediminis]BDU77118.1 transposase [Mesoterricola sediminis]